MSEDRKWYEAIEEAARGKPTPLRRLDHFEEAQEGADLHAIYRDLEFVRSAAEYLAEILEAYDSEAGPTPDTRIVERSLYTAALVAYKRCFDHGKRLRLTPDSVFFGETEGLREDHQYFVKARDKHVAHSVNPFEINMMAAYVEDAQDGEIEVEVGAVHLPRTTDDSPGARLLASLAEHAMVIVHQRSEAALDVLWNRVESLSQEELRALKPLMIDLEEGLDAVGKERPPEEARGTILVPVAMLARRVSRSRRGKHPRRGSMDDIYRDFAQQGQEQAARDAMYRNANIRQQAEHWGVSLALAEHLVKLEERIRELEQRGG